MTTPIPLSAPDVTNAEEAALIRGFRSGWIAPLGPEVDAFEAELADLCGRRHCVALSSGTAALHLGLLNLGVQAGDRVLTSSMTFAATANAITYLGAVPVFVDSDETGSINPDLLQQALSDQLEQGHQVTAIVPVDLLGKVVDHDRIGEISLQHNIPVLSDAAESLGSRRAGRPAASYGELAAVSFNGNKIMTTSGGGALLTDSAELAQRTRYLATQARQPQVHYEHTEIGYNYRLSNLLAALGRAQLERLEAMIARRRSLRSRYRDLFADIAGVSFFGEPAESPDHSTRDNFWLTSILVDPAIAGWSTKDLMSRLAAEAIESRPLWKPMHLQPVHRDRPAYIDGTSERMFRTGLSLPSGSGITDEQFDRIGREVREFLGGQR